jgi:hypothetical protein
MARLGHSTVNASLIYQQAVDGRAEEVAEAPSALATGRSERWPRQSQKPSETQVECDFGAGGGIGK